MRKKCEKYESLFVFGSEEDLIRHVQQCDDCKEEHLKMQKTEALIKEVKPYFLVKKRDRSRLIKSAAALFLVSIVTFVMNLVFIPEKKFDNSLTLKEETSVIADMGLPTDEYGLLMVY